MPSDNHTNTIGSGYLRQGCVMPASKQCLDVVRFMSCTGKQQVMHLLDYETVCFAGESESHLWIYSRFWRWHL